MSAPELLPCPFCGADAYISGDTGDGFFVGCVECFCNVGEGYDRSAMPSHGYRSEDDAIAAWNTRDDLYTAALAENAHLREELATARDRALDEAAAIADAWANCGHDFNVADEIRALKGAKP